MAKVSDKLKYGLASGGGEGLIPPLDGRLPFC